MAEAPPRLPEDVVPTHYDLHISLDLDAPPDAEPTFAGEVSIQLDVKRAASSLLLHAAELEIQSVEVVVGSSAHAPKATALNKKHETLRVELAEPLQPGAAAALRVRYRGVMNDRLVGCYRSSYADAAGRKRWMAVTQFEATHARRALPCWDEPAFKATFSVTLEAPADRTLLSCMPPEDSTAPAPGRQRVRFARTPRMSTYLLAWTAGEFDFVEARTPEGATVRVYTPVGRADLGSYALDVAVRSLSFFTGYFATPYPLPKMDLVAVPDFSFGAMENWGLCVFRETALLIDAAQSSAAVRQRVAEIVAHELCHQWFGNLVSPAWWSQLWLNEGFATWGAHVAVDALRPEWEYWTQFAAVRLGLAHALDALESTHAVEVEVADAGEISEIFDAVSYSKGASLIRMLAAYMGPDAFRDGLRRYLPAHAYGNATTEDLWGALAAAAAAAGRPLDVKAAMDRWTKAPGYPLVEVTEVEGGGARRLRFAQRRFLRNGPGPRGGNAEERWRVPVVLAVEGRPEPLRFLLEGESVEVEVAAPAGAFLKANAGQTGFYRVHYGSPGLAAGLCRAVRDHALPSPDRLGLLADALAMCRAGLAEEGAYFDLLEAVRDGAPELDAAVWSEVAAGADALTALIAEEAEALRAALDRFYCGLFGPALDRLGLQPAPGEAHTRSVLRALLVGQLGARGEARVLAWARAQFAAGRGAVHADLRAAVYATVAAHGGEAEWEALLALAREPGQLHEERLRCVRALGCARSPALLARALALALDPAEVRPQDAPGVVLAVAESGAEGRRLAWGCLRDRWPLLEARYAANGMLLSRLVAGVCGDLSGPSHAGEVEGFFAGRDAPFARRAVAQSLERIRGNAAWRPRAVPRLLQAPAPPQGLGLIKHATSTG